MSTGLSSVEEVIARIPRLSRELNVPERTVQRAVAYGIAKHWGVLVERVLPSPIEELEQVVGRLEELDLKRIARRLSENPDYIDRVFEAVLSPTYRKVLGQFTTPRLVADFMAQWATRDADSCLDPALGTGVFFASAHRTRGDGIRKYRAFDVDPLMVNLSALRLATLGIDMDRCLFDVGDFLPESFAEEKFGAILCNPPYLNFHDYDSKEMVRITERRVGSPLSKLTNIYALFFMHALDWIQLDGRLAFITPSEFLYTGYGKQLKRFLVQNTSLDALILVDFAETLFENALTTALVTLFRKGRASKNHRVRFITVRNWTEESSRLLLKILDLEREGTLSGIDVRIHDQDQLDPNVKWQRYFSMSSHVPGETHELLVPLSKLAKVSRGIATGHNEFFLLSPGEVRDWDIPEEFLRPALSQARQVGGYDFNQDDLAGLVDQGESIFLFWCFAEATGGVLRYVQHGEKMGANQRYLTRLRKPWYSMEKRNPAPILATVFSRERMRFVWNRTNALNLAAFHCIYPRFNDPVALRALLAYLNSSEFRRRQTIWRREYGGGLHKFEPSDLDDVPVLDVLRLPSAARGRLAGLFDELCDASRKGLAQEPEVKRAIDGLLRKLLL